MSALPLSELLTPGLVALGFALAWPPLASRLLGVMRARSRRAVILCAVVSAIGVAWFGSRTLGPSLVDARWGLGNLAAAAGVAAVVAAGFTRHWKKRRGQDPKSGLALVLALLLGACMPLCALASDVLTREPEDAASAWWRVRLEPWDAGAWRELAWASRHREDPERARARLAVARRLDLAPSDATELEAELVAYEGDCEGARTLFERSLHERAAEVITRNERLELGGWRLMPGLVACGITPGEEPEEPDPAAAPPDDALAAPR